MVEAWVPYSYDVTGVERAATQVPGSGKPHFTRTTSGNSGMYDVSVEHIMYTMCTCVQPIIMFCSLAFCSMNLGIQHVRQHFIREVPECSLTSLGSEPLLLPAALTMYSVVQLLTCQYSVLHCNENFEKSFFGGKKVCGFDSYPYHICRTERTKSFLMFDMQEELCIMVFLKSTQ